MPKPSIPAILLRARSRRWTPALRRGLSHIFPAPAPVRFPDGYASLLPIVLAANNLVLPPTTDFLHGYADPDGIYTANHGRARPLSVATRTVHGALVDHERVIPFFVSHHPHQLPPPPLPVIDSDARACNSQAVPTRFGGPPKPIGWLIPEVAAAISRDHLRHFARDSASPWDIRYFEPEDMADEQDSIGQMVKSVAFADWVNEGGSHARTLHIERLLLDWKRKKVFGELLKGWSEDQYPVFHHSTSSLSGEGPLAFGIERAALPLFGLANYGALLTAYVHNPDTNQTSLWIPQRSKHKTNAPGRLDVTAGGGMCLGGTPLSTILREASEEALLDMDYVSTFIKPVGTVPFLHRSQNLPTCPLVVKPNATTTEDGALADPASTSSSSSKTHVPKPHTFSLHENPTHTTAKRHQQYILPGHYYLFELPLPVDLTVRPQENLLDGDVDSFRLLPVEEVLAEVVKGKFKRSSALAIIDFLIRGGWVTEENDAYYADVVRVLRGGLGGGAGVPVPWRLYV